MFKKIKLKKYLKLDRDLKKNKVIDESNSNTNCS